MANAAFSPLRHRRFLLTLSSSFVSSTGTWMQSVTLGVYLWDTTHSSTWLGIVTAALWMPALVASPLGGVIADRWNRQHWIQLNNLVMAACATTLAVCAFTNELSPRLIVALALIEGFSSAGSWAAWQSLLPDLVDRNEVLAAVSLSAAQFNLGRIIGPSLAGLVLSVGSYGWCFAINAGTFVYVFIAFAFVRTAPREPKITKLRVFHEVMEGARAAWGNAACRNAILAIAVISFVLSPFISQIPAMARHVLHGSRATVGWFTTAQGVGAVLAAFTLPTLAHRTSRLVVLRGALGALAVSVIAYGLAPTKSWALLALFVVGAAYMGCLNQLNASVQLHAPAAERSRILGLYTMALSVGFPLGSVVEGRFADLFGLRAVTVTAGALGVVGLLSVLSWRPEFLRAMGANPQLQLANVSTD